MNPDARPLEVAVGVLRDAAGRVLISQRPPGGAFAGQWEFPGGKVHADEAIEDALARELREELGVRIDGRRPLITLTHRYNEFFVRLNVMEVLDYEGEPRGVEGQELRWIAPEALAGVDLLAANAGIVRAVRLPRLCLITDLERFGVEPSLRHLERHVQAAPVLLIVREKAVSGGRLAGFIADARRICRAHGSLLCVHADCALAHEVVSDGIHWPASALRAGRLAKNGLLTGASCHDEEEIRLARECGADYALLSPVKPTASHPGAKPLGWPVFREYCDRAALPVYALGGMQWRDQDDAIRHGAQGIAMLSAAWR